MRDVGMAVSRMPEGCSVSNDSSDIEWRCGCGHTNSDCEDRCNGCGAERYSEDNDPFFNLYSDESHRMQQAQELKR